MKRTRLLKDKNQLSKQGTIAQGQPIQKPDDLPGIVQNEYILTAPNQTRSNSIFDRGLLPPTDRGTRNANFNPKKNSTVQSNYEHALLTRHQTHMTTGPASTATDPSVHRFQTKRHSGQKGDQSLQPSIKESRSRKQALRQIPIQKRTKFNEPIGSEGEHQYGAKTLRASMSEGARKNGNERANSNGSSVFDDVDNNSVIDQIAQQVLTGVMIEEYDIDKEDKVPVKRNASHNYSDASSDEFDENKDIKIAPIKELLDQQYQLNNEQRKMLQGQLNNYSRGSERQKLDQLVHKMIIGESSGDSSTGQYQLERQGDNSERNDTLMQLELNDAKNKEENKKNAQNYLFQMLKQKIILNYINAKKKVDEKKEQQMDEVKDVMKDQIRNMMKGKDTDNKVDIFNQEMAPTEQQIEILNEQIMRAQLRDSQLEQSVEVMPQEGLIIGKKKQNDPQLQTALSPIAEYQQDQDQDDLSSKEMAMVVDASEQVRNSKAQFKQQKTINEIDNKKPQNLNNLTQEINLDQSVMIQQQQVTNMNSMRSSVGQIESRQKKLENNKLQKQQENLQTRQLIDNLVLDPITKNNSGPNIRILQEHSKAYLSNKTKIDMRYLDLQSTQRIYQRFKTQKIKCVKYNYSLDDEVQKNCQQEGYFQLSQNGKKLLIFNKYTIRKPDYVLNPDYQEVLQKRNEYQATLKKDENGKVCDDNFVEGVDYVWKKSNASCNLDEIEGIIYGGISSRFWMLRKYMISQSVRQIKNGNIPFFSWQCLTLQLKSRDVDLVIPNQQDMDDVIEFLVDTLNTVNGCRNSAAPVKKIIQDIKFKRENKRQQSLQRRKDLKGIAFLDNEKIKDMTILTPNELNQVKRTTQIKYKIMRVRAKISFMAFQKGMTILEMILNQLMKSFSAMALHKENELDDFKDHFDLYRLPDFIFQELISHRLNVVIQNVEKVNSDASRSEDMINYLKLKYRKSITLLKNIPKPDKKVEKEDKTTGKILQKHKDGPDGPLTLEKSGNSNAQFASKTRSANIFLLVSNGQENTLIDKTNYKDNIQYNQHKEKVMFLYSTLKFLVNMKALHGVFMLKALLAKMQVAKQLFILEIEQGHEAYIPNELSCDNLPCSFWFYDACLQQAQDLVNDEKKKYAMFKNHYQLSFYQKNDFKKEILKKMGIYNEGNTKKVNLAQRFQAINEIESNEIDHRVITTKGNLQKSRYVMIDNDVKRLQEHYKILGSDQKKEMEKQIVIRGFSSNAKQSAKFRQEARKLILRYCPDQEIFSKRQKNLVMKSTFLTKIRFLKLMGKKQQLMQRADCFIQDNIDMLYDNYLIKNPRMKTNKKTLYEVVMADKVQKENDDLMKQKLHSVLLDIIQKWLKRQLILLRKSSIEDVYRKTDKNLDFFTKNLNIDNGIEMHIKWYTKGKKLDTGDAMQAQVKNSKKKLLILGKDQDQQEMELDQKEKRKVPLDAKELKIRKKIDKIRMSMRGEGDTPPDSIEIQKQNEQMRKLLKDLDLLKIRNLNQSIISQQHGVNDLTADLENKKLQLNKIMVNVKKESLTKGGAVNDQFQIKKTRNFFWWN